MKVPNFTATMLSVLIASIWTDGSWAEQLHEPTIVPGSRQHMLFKIKTQANSEQFQIVLQNCGTRIVKCQDFRHASSISRTVPWFTFIYVREKDHPGDIHLLPDEDYSWYTWSIYVSELGRFHLVRLLPGQRIQQTYPLKGIATAMFEKTVLKREHINDYEYKLVTTLCITDVHHVITTESKWLPFPAGFLQDYDVW